MRSPPLSKQRMISPTKPNVRTGQPVEVDSAGAQAAAQVEIRADPTKTKCMPKEAESSPIKQGKDLDELSESEREDPEECLHAFHNQEIVTAFAGLACDDRDIV